MASQKVKCLYCGEIFDKNDCEYEQPRTNRYAHKSCCTENNNAYIIDCIKNYAKEQLGETYNAAKVKKNIESFIAKGRTPQEIYKTLKYIYDVEHNDPMQANGGIVFVEYKYDDARKWYQKQEQIKKRFEQINIQDYIAPTKTVHATKKPIRRPKRYELIDL